LSFDQSDGVGAFIGLSKDPTDPHVPPEVGPARIRAVRGEQITWVFRNPSDQDVQVQLQSVFDLGNTTDNILNEIFQPAPPATIPADCGIGYYQARLRNRIAIGQSPADTCSFRPVNYYFLIQTTTDTLRLKFSYDPELIIHGYP